MMWAFAFFHLLVIFHFRLYAADGPKGTSPDSPLAHPIESATQKHYAAESNNTAWTLESAAESTVVIGALGDDEIIQLDILSSSLDDGENGNTSLPVDYYSFYTADEIQQRLFSHPSDSNNQIATNGNDNWAEAICGLLSSICLGEECNATADTIDFHRGMNLSGHLQCGSIVDIKVGPFPDYPAIHICPYNKPECEVLKGDKESPSWRDRGGFDYVNEEEGQRRLPLIIINPAHLPTELSFMWKRNGLGEPTVHARVCLPPVKECGLQGGITVCYPSAELGHQNGTNSTILPQVMMQFANFPEMLAKQCQGSSGTRVTTSTNGSHFIIQTMPGWNNSSPTDGGDGPPIAQIAIKMDMGDVNQSVCQSFARCRDRLVATMMTMVPSSVDGGDGKYESTTSVAAALSNVNGGSEGPRSTTSVAPAMSSVDGGSERPRSTTSVAPALSSVDGGSEGPRSTTSVAPAMSSVDGGSERPRSTTSVAPALSSVDGDGGDGKYESTTSVTAALSSVDGGSEGPRSTTSVAPAMSNVDGGDGSSSNGGGASVWMFAGILGALLLLSSITAAAITFILIARRANLAI